MVFIFKVQRNVKSFIFPVKLKNITHCIFMFKVKNIITVFRKKIKPLCYLVFQKKLGVAM